MADWIAVGLGFALWSMGVAVVVISVSIIKTTFFED